MRHVRRAILMTLAMLLAAAAPAIAADESAVKSATRRVENGAHAIGRGEIGRGIEETAKGIGFTVYEGAKFTGEKFKEAGRSAGSAPSFPDGVKNFFATLFSN